MKAKVLVSPKKERAVRTASKKSAAENSFYEWQNVGQTHCV